MKEIDSFYGVRFSNLTSDSLVSILCGEKKSNRILVTPNVDFLMRYIKKNSEDFNFVIDCADFCICDSRILKLLSKIKKIEIPDVITGSDLTRNILLDNGFRNKKILFIGPSDNDYKILISKFNLRDTFNVYPPFGFEYNENFYSNMKKDIVEFQPEIIFIALGSPKQEILAKRVAGFSVKSDILCIGASLDFLTGKTKRAPSIYSKLHLEWLYRWFSEPKRLSKRYLSNLCFLTELTLGKYK
jgi:N-acetylglucosaminyldiphosphoundecaprenol N-acetyl-beta-D-mannosaminyltransferase